MKKLTVFTPTYNRAYILTQCYNSLVNQTNNDFIWLIVDDGSTDDTEDLVNKFISEGKIEITYIFQNNGGKYKAINNAIKNCKTELFSFLDSDDYYKNDTVEQFLVNWETIKNDSSVAGIVARRCNKEGKIVGSQNIIKDGLINFSNLRFKWNFYGDTCRMYRTNILKKCLYPELDVKFIPENVMLGKIDEKYNVLFLNKALSVSEYLEDGYTKSYKNLLYRYPYSYLLSLKQDIINHPSFFGKCKKTVAYIEWSKIYDLTNAYRESNNKLLYILLYPIAMIMLLLGVPKWYKYKGSEKNE